MKKILLIVSFIFVLTSKNFGQAGVKHILLEEFSTAPCGFCPDGDLVAAQLIIDHPQVIWLTHHAGFGVDSMTVPESVTIANAFTQFAPGAAIDRGDYPIPVYTMPPYIAISRQKWDSVCVAHLNDPPVVDVFITNQYDSVTRLLNCTVDATFLTAPATGDLRLNLFLVEDSVVGFGQGYDQTNYYNTTLGHPYYGAGDPIVGYVHHHTVRKVQTGAWGMTGVIPNSPLAGSTYSHTFTNIPILSAWKDDDIDVIAFVSYYDTSANLRQVINSNQKKLTDATTNVITINHSASQILVYPNPASGQVYVSRIGTPGSESKIMITDFSGKEVLSGQLQQNNSIIETKNISNGIYFYKVLSENGIVGQGKIAIVH
jgi:outer membrane protein Omp28/type IX secretion system substrate protein